MPAPDECGRLERPDVVDSPASSGLADNQVRLVDRRPVCCLVVEYGRNSSLVELVVFFAGGSCNPGGNPGGRLHVGRAVWNPRQLLGPSNHPPCRVHAPRDLPPAELHQPVRDNGVLRPPRPLKAPLRLAADEYVRRDGGPDGNVAAVSQKPARTASHGQLCNRHLIGY